MTTQETETEYVRVDPHPESNYWLTVVRGNIDFIAANYKKDLNKLNKAMEKTENEDDAGRCNLLREFVKKYHGILDADTEMLIHWAVRNNAGQTHDIDYIHAKNRFHENLRGEWNE